MAGRKDRFDWPIFALYVALVAIGWFMQYAVNQTVNSSTEWSLSGPIGTHTAWVGVSLIVFLAGQLIDERLWKTLAYPIYATALILLVLVLLLGVEINDARSWFVFWGFSFQPGEFAKMGTILALCAYLSPIQTRLKEVRSQWMVLALIAMPILLVTLQPDPGTALVFLSFFILFYREGMPAGYYYIAIFAILSMFAGLLLPFQDVIMWMTAVIILIFSGNLFRSWSRIAIFTVILVTLFVHYTYKPIVTPAWSGLFAVVGLITIYKAWSSRQKFVVSMMPIILLIGISMASISGFVFQNVLQPHHRDRINAWLQPGKCDPQGSLYNIIQSKVAIGSGGLVGKGFLDGSMTQLNFVPEQATDFIFSTIGEEQGFLGSLAVISLFVALILRIIYIGEKRENNFIRVYAYGLAGVLFIHVFINIGMTMGLVPVVGIPLPFISKGGSALMIFSMMLSVFLRLAKSRL